jgi:hypothetical protein
MYITLQWRNTERSKMRNLIIVVETQDALEEREKATAEKSNSMRT